MTAPAVSPPPLAPPPRGLVVAISSRALFDLEDGHRLYEREGLDAYCAYQRQHEDSILRPGVAFALVDKLLAINAGGDPLAPAVEVVLLSRNSSDTGLRIFNSIEHHGLPIVRAAFTNGASPYRYLRPFGAQLFVSNRASDVRDALRAGAAAAVIRPAARAPTDRVLRIALDGDALHDARVFAQRASDAAMAIRAPTPAARPGGDDAASAPGAPADADPAADRRFGPFEPLLAALAGLQRARPAHAPRVALASTLPAADRRVLVDALRARGLHLDSLAADHGQPHAALPHADLSPMDAPHADLPGAAFTDTTVPQASSQPAVLPQAVQPPGDLTHADLTHADLTHAVLTHAVSTHADLLREFSPDIVLGSLHDGPRSSA